MSEEWTVEEEAIVALLRYKRTKPEGIITDINDLQRKMEALAGVSGVQLAPEYDK